MDRIEHFLLPEHTNKLYTEEAISSISLTRDVADKINELIDCYNTLNQNNLTKMQEQDGTIRKAVLYMKDNLLNSLHDLMVQLRDSGFIDNRIKYHINVLIDRVDNLTGAITEGTTTLDSELIDIRVGYDGEIYNNAGNSVRGQMNKMDNLKLNKVDSVKARCSTDNLLLEDWFIEGTYYSADGVFAEHANSGHYPLVEVQPNTLYTYFGCQILVMFDENMNVTGKDTELRESFKTITTTATTKYIAVSKSLNQTFKSGLYLGEYSGQVKAGQKMYAMEQIQGLAELAKTVEESIKGTVGKNIFNKNSEDIVSGQYVLYSDGSSGGNASYSYLYIDVEPATTYTCNSNANEHIAFFDVNGKYITGLSTNTGRTFTTPDNVSYMSFSFKTENIHKLQIEKGSVSTTYSEYEKGLSGSDLNDGSVSYDKLSEDVKDAIGSAKRIVTIGTNGDYQSITEAIMSNGNNTIFRVYSGTYDIEAEYKAYFGSNYFTAYKGYQATGNVYDRGLNLSEGCELIGIGDVEIVFNYSGSNSIVKQYFAPLNTTSDNTVENITFRIKDGSCRYIIHDDFATLAGKNTFKNLFFYGASYLNTAIGGGMGTNNLYLIENCYFEGAGGLCVTYHNNVKPAMNKLIVKGCCCDGSIRATHYGTGTEKSMFMVSNCKALSVGVAFGDQTVYPNENIKLIEWNNVKG